MSWYRKYLDFFLGLAIVLTGLAYYFNKYIVPAYTQWTTTPVSSMQYMPITADALVHLFVQQMISFAPLFILLFFVSIFIWIFKMLIRCCSGRGAI